jgi:ATP/maltotriose-dependent transcriptional regulator MalT
VPWLHMDHGFYYRLWRLDWACNDGQYEEILRDAQGAASGPDRSWVAAEALDTLVKAIVRSRQGRERDAAALFAEAFELLKEAGYVVHLPYYYNALAEFHLRKNNFDEALHNVSEAGRIARYYGIPLAEVDSYLVEAEVLIARGSVDEARDIQEKASELIGNHGYNLKTLETTLLQAQIALLSTSI